MGILANENAIQTGGYNIANSLRFQSASSNWMNRTPAGVGTSNKIMTFSAWVKRGAFATLNGLFTGSGGTVDGIQFWNNNIDVFFNNGATRITTSAVYRDPSAWYHIVVTVDTPQASAANRVRIYVNGSQVTATTGTAPAQNYSFSWNQNNQQRFGTDGGSNFFDGYTAEVNVIDGQALTPSSFGETNTLTGQWVAKKYTGTYGTNGFYLPFSNGTSTTTLGADSSGNGNNWTLNNFTRSAGVSDCWMYDVPSGNGSSVGGTQPNSNYCVLNAVNPLPSGYLCTRGNLEYITSVANAGHIEANFVISSGKWYWEYTVSSGNNIDLHGVCRVGLAATSYAWTETGSVGYYGFDGQKYVSGVNSAYGASFTNGAVIGTALDKDAGTITFYKNGVSQGVISLPTTDNLVPYFADGSGGSATSGDVNFGQRSFAYTPPSGFKALCTANLPASTIVKGNQYMDATLYTGTGSTQSITNAGGFSPDLVWLKKRGGGVSAQWHMLADTIRGTGATLSSNVTDAEYTGKTSVTAFNSNGFTLGADSTGASYYGWNIASDTYVGWQWDAGSSTVTNTSGTISSQVRANPTAGVSVVTYTNPASGTFTVGHGLGVAPAMMILKSRDTAGTNWVTYHRSLGNTQAIYLNLTNAATTNTTWNNTSPTSSVFTGTTLWLGTNITYVAYCFSEIAGFSKFGSYTGNGSTDGAFTFTGFTPKFIMTKRSDSTSAWVMIDTSRSVSNVATNRLYANESSAEDSADTAFDILSNGFKCRTTNTTTNASGGTYIYMAFASNPFSASNAR